MGMTTMNTVDEEEVEDDDRLETRVSSPDMFFSYFLFVTNFLFVLGMNHRTTGMPDNGGTCQWHWQGREGRCDECSLVMDRSVGIWDFECNTALSYFILVTFVA